MYGTSSRPVVLAMPCTDIWKPCLQLLLITKCGEKTKKLLRHAFKFAELPFDRNADPFSAVIRCTSDDNADDKTISKWARALRYVSRCKERGMPLREFMKETGGVNACADLYAQRLGK